MERQAESMVAEQQLQRQHAFLHQSLRPQQVGQCQLQDRRPLRETCGDFVPLGFVQ